MLKTKKQMWITLLGGLALVALVTGGWMFRRTEAVSAAETLENVTQASAMPGLLGEGYLNQRGGPDFPGIKGGDIDYQQLLADALGISVDDLQAAYETARDAAIDQAVAQGLLTQEQADTMKVWRSFGGRRGGDVFHFGRAPKEVAGGDIDENALLADALGITVEKLQAARKAANQAAIEQAIAEGLITQEQADAMQARKNLTSYLDRDTLLAKALGMTAEELQTAYDEGKTLTDLLNDTGLDAAAVRENLQTARTEAIAQAVADGVITQEQADEMEDGRGFGLMPGNRMPGDRMPGNRHPGSRDNYRERDNSGDDGPSTPDTDM